MPLNRLCRMQLPKTWEQDLLEKKHWKTVFLFYITIVGSAHMRSVGNFFYAPYFRSENACAQIRLYVGSAALGWAASTD